MWHTSFPKVWTCCYQCLIQPRRLFPCSCSVSVNTGFLFSCFSPAQLFAVTETLSISQAASCLIDELLQRCDSHTLAHGFFCFSFHICKKLHFLPLSFHFCFYVWVTVYGDFLFLYQNAKCELPQPFTINSLVLGYFILLLEFMWLCSTHKMKVGEMGGSTEWERENNMNQMSSG